MTRTQWFPVSTPPVHVGWYEYLDVQSSKVDRHFWSGSRWSVGNYDFNTDFFARPGDQWRGLTERAK